MIGEIRDAETARIAVQASLTGHLVFSTVHTISAAETVTRLIDMGIEHFPARLDLARDHGSAAGAPALPGLRDAER